MAEPYKLGKKKTKLLTLLVSVNILLFVIIAILVVGGKSFYHDVSKWPEEIKVGYTVSTLVEKSNSLKKIFEITESKLIAFVFFEDSVLQRAREFVGYINACKPSLVSSIIFPFVPDKRPLGDNYTDSLHFLPDENGVISSSFRIHCSATVIVDRERALVLRVYPFVLNPYSLCEQLEVLHNL